MAERNKIAANTAVFKRLDEYCSVREEPLSNAGERRWIATTESGQAFLKRALLVEQLSFSSSVKIARFDHSNRAYFVTSGLDVEPLHGLDFEDLDGGILTAFLSEVGPRPVVAPLEIRNLVEFEDKRSAGYGGHDPVRICSLFPRIQIFSTLDLSLEETFKVFFVICLADRRRIDQWIDQQLADALAAITKLSPASIPYEVLCRAVLDMDPATLFLALYRCLEALYACAHAHAFMTTIGVEKDWIEMAEMLETTLGWYPREEPSLEALLIKANLEDLRGVAAALKDTIPNGAKESSFVARKIYRLRNALVHYRPFHRKVSTRDVDWNRLCEGMASLVCHAHQECAG